MHAAPLARARLLNAATDKEIMTMHYDIVSKPLPWQTAGLQQTASGYGSKLTSRLMVRVHGESRLRRVYVTCWSNSGTAWFVHSGAKVCLPDTVQAGDTVTAP